MDHSTFNFTPEDYIHLSLAGVHIEESSDIPVLSSKRQAMYFPETPAGFEEDIRDDDDGSSTWEFSAVSTHDSQASSEGYDSRRSSAAQEIAQRYRAGLPSKLVLDDPLATPDEQSGWFDDSDAISETNSTLRSTPKSIKPRYRRSRVQAFDKLREEACHVMLKNGRGEHDVLVCERYGCRDIVTGVDALIRHLHIHDIGNKHVCPECQKSFESYRALSVHVCACYEEMPPRPFSPFKGFRNIKISCWDIAAFD